MSRIAQLAYVDATSHVKSDCLDFYLPEQFLMSVYFPFLGTGFLISAIAMLIPAGASFAHHSFAPCDIRNAVEIAGVAEDFA